MRPQSGATKGGTHVGQSTGPHGDTGGKEACARRRARARAPRSSPRRYPGRGGTQPRPRRWGPLEPQSPRDSGWDPSTACGTPRGPGVAAAWVPRSGSSPGPPPALPSQSGLTGGWALLSRGWGRAAGAAGAHLELGGRRARALIEEAAGPLPRGPGAPRRRGVAPPPAHPSPRERERAWRSAAVCRGTSEETLLRLQKSPIDDDLLRAAGGGLGLGGDPGRCEGRPRCPRPRQPARAPGNPARGGSFRSETGRGGHRLLVPSAA